MHTASTTTVSPTEGDDAYPQFLAAISARATQLAKGLPLFTTDAAGLFETFLQALPPDRRQHYTCNACRRFVDRFGGLVTLSPEGVSTPLFWGMEGVPDFFRPAVQALATRVKKAMITGVFLSSDKVWGLPVNRDPEKGEGGPGPGVWHHLAWTPNVKRVYVPVPNFDAGQRMAEKGQDFETLTRGIREYPLAVVRAAHAYLTNGALPRSEKALGVAAWLLALHEALAGTRNEFTREAILWHAAATAPAGFCHVKSSMIGTLLDDIAVELPFEEIKRRWSTKMDPLQYQRPQAPPTAGNIAAAEKIVGALRSAGALERRFAKLEEVEALWRPAPTKPPTPPTGGVFGHLHPVDKGACVPPSMPTVTMTWVKFQAQVLPNAEKIELYVPGVDAAYSALVTAANPEAPPILQWDSPEKRNPVSWYVYHQGSSAVQWGLKARTYVPVTAVTYQPSMWGNPEGFAHQGKSVFFLLEGAHDIAYRASGGFFPETLRAEYHAVRRTMEAYARSATIVGAETATACGLKLEAGKPWTETIVRVTSKGVVSTYKLDRWD